MYIYVHICVAVVSIEYMEGNLIWKRNKVKLRFASILETHVNLYYYVVCAYICAIWYIKITL